MHALPLRLVEYTITILFIMLDLFNMLCIALPTSEEVERKDSLALASISYPLPSQTQYVETFFIISALLSLVIILKFESHMISS